MIKINDKFKPLFIENDAIRYIVITGGRGSSKSFSVTTFLSLLTYEAGHTILFTRYTLQSAYLSIIPEFLEKLSLLGIEKDFHVTKTDIINKRNGNRILFRGIHTSNGDQTASLKSLQGISIWVVDEAEELTDERKFDTIDLSVRQQGIANKVILILNPTTKEHFIYNKFFQSKGVNEGHNGVSGDTLYIHTTYKDNIEHLSDSFLKSVDEMRVRRPEKYNQQILGGWRDKAEGIIFDNWTIGKWNNTIPSVFGQDFGFSNDPTTLTETCIDIPNKKIWIREHYGKIGMTTSDIYEMNKMITVNGLIIGDSAEPRLIHEVKLRGINIKPTKKAPGSVLAGINLMLDYDMIIDPSSTELIKELNNYVWSDKKSGTPVDNYNHYIDAARYAIQYQLEKKKRDYKSTII